MVLGFSIVIGLFAGVVRARVNQVSYEIPGLRWYGIALISFIPQYLVFNTPYGRDFPNWIVSAALVASQSLLLLFVAVNLTYPGFLILGTGLTLNLIVILLNGGLMPISPEVVYRLRPEIPSYAFQIYKRFGSGKDVILPVSETRLQFLSDRFLLPDWVPYQVAFSLGDVLLAVGMVIFLWELGGVYSQKKEQS